MKQQVVVGTLFCVLAFSSCGKSKLSEDQKAEVKAVLSSSSGLETAGNNRRSSNVNSGAHSVKVGAVLYKFSTLAAAAVSSGSGITSELDGRLADSSATKDCKFTPLRDFAPSTSSASSSGSSGSSGHGSSGSVSVDGEFKIEGDGCPIAFDFAEKMSMDSASMDVSVSVSAEIKSEEFKKLNDVSAEKMQMHVTAKTSGTSAEMSMDGTGSITSQSKGNVSLKFEGKIEGNNDSAKGEIKMTIGMPKYNVELKIKANGKELKYAINDEDVTKADFESFTSNFSANKAASSSQ